MFVEKLSVNGKCQLVRLSQPRGSLQSVTYVSGPDICQPTARAGRSGNRRSKARETNRGCKEDPRALTAAIAARSKGSRLQHDSRRAGSSWPREQGHAVENADRGYTAVRRS